MAGWINSRQLEVIDFLRRRTGRPAVAIDVEQLVIRMAVENPAWGYTRLVGALDNLGRQVGRNAVKRVLRRHGLEPAPARRK
jgi:putative transposase